MTLSYFPDTKTLTMQQEALKRVRDMQLRARQSVEQSNVFPDSGFQQTVPMQPSGPPAQSQFPVPPPSYQMPFQSQPLQQSAGMQPSPFARQPQQNMRLQSNMPQGFPPQNMLAQGSLSQDAQQQQQPALQGNMRQGTQRQSGGAQPNNILAHLFGGGRQSGSQNQNSGGQRNGSQNQSASRPGASGLLDLLRKQGLGDSIGGLGETLQNTISSVSEPLSGILDGFGIDGEKLVILLVMWAIFNEHKDNKMLLMALGYLLL